MSEQGNAQGPDPADRREELLIGLAINALDTDEDVREAEHLARTDEEAAATLRRYRAVAAELASAHETAPPPELKDAVMDRIGTASEPPPSLSGRQRRYQTTAWVMTAVAAVSLAVAVPAVTVAISQYNRAVEATEASGQDGDYGDYAEISRLLTVPGTTVSSEQSDTGEGSLALIVSGDADDDAAVIARGLPELSDDRVYQLWSLDAAGTPTSAGVMEGTEDVVVTPSGMAMGTDSAVAVTEEPTGGSASPTTDPLIVLAVGE